MKSYKIIIRFILLTIIVLFELSNAFSASSKDSTTPKTSERFISIDFNNVDINVFIKFISELTGKNFVVDNRVKGKVTIISPDKISVEEAYKVFESVLEVHDFAAVETGKVIKIIPAQSARTKSIETMLREESSSPDDSVVTQVISLKYANPAEIKRLFSPLISKNSVLLEYLPTNVLIVTDTQTNIHRLIKILRTVDVAGVGQEITLFPIEFADANKIVTILSSVFKIGQKPQQRSLSDLSEIQLVGDERTNTIIVLASEDNTGKIRNVIKMLDKQTPQGKSRIQVYYLEHANAEELAKVLQEMPAKGGDAASKGKAPIISDKIKITADKSTNSIIITAEKDDFAAIEDIIKKLDIPRPMVYIECLIMEVNVDKGISLGTEWQVMGKTYLGDSAQNGGIGSGFGGGGDSTFGNIGKYLPTPTKDAPATVGSFPPGFTLGILSQPLKIGDITFPSLAAVIQSLRKDKNVNILSTPQILTMDNQEAIITVGKNIPYLTKSGTTSSSETYNTYEYKDVGISLKLTPQISKDGVIKLKISQEVTKVDQLSTAVTGATQPTTLKRTINTGVIVNDKNTVVIGGLIDDSFTKTQNKVPCLGDIPAFGWLFKYASQSSEKTNLFVFITPHVIKNPKDAVNIYKEKRGSLEKLEESNIKLYEKPMFKRK
ncbi:MAG: type II secretion system secretin GspD [Desulfobacterales bacterium]|nr:type II secretion system secretin GspD [Desulfobacterales bacterium]